MQRCWPRAPAESSGIGLASRFFASNHVLVLGNRFFASNHVLVLLMLVFFPFTTCFDFRTLRCIDLLSICCCALLHSKSAIPSQSLRCFNRASISLSDIRYVRCSGSENVHCSLLIGRPVNHRPHEVNLAEYFTFFAQSKPPKSMPAQWGNTREGNFRRLMHRFNNKNC